MPKSKIKNLKKKEMPAADVANGGDFEDDDDQIFWPLIKKLSAWIVFHRRFTLPAAAAVFLALTAWYPVTRYALAGTVVKRDLTVYVKDQQHSLPISQASVAVGDDVYLTDGEGRVTIADVPVGRRTINVFKRFYQSSSQQAEIKIFSNTNILEVRLDTHEYKIPVQVRDAITGQRLAGVIITAGGTESISDHRGEATITMPQQSKPVTVKLQKGGYTTLKSNIIFTQEVIKHNTFLLQPNKTD